MTELASQMASNIERSQHRGSYDYTILDSLTWMAIVAMLFIMAILALSVIVYNIKSLARTGHPVGASYAYRSLCPVNQALQVAEYREVDEPSAESSPEEKRRGPAY